MVFNYTLDQTGNKTISIITLTVAAENNDAELVCRASNAFFPSDTIEDTRIINVACKLQMKHEKSIIYLFNCMLMYSRTRNRKVNYITIDLCII